MRCAPWRQRQETVQSPAPDITSAQRQGPVLPSHTRGARLLCSEYLDILIIGWSFREMQTTSTRNKTVNNSALKWCWMSKFLRASWQRQHYQRQLLHLQNHHQWLAKRMSPLWRRHWICRLTTVSAVFLQRKDHAQRALLASTTFPSLRNVFLSSSPAVRY